MTAVRAAAAGQAVFGAALAQRLRTWFTRGAQKPAEPFPQLTAREREILDGVAAGLTNAQIGQQMFLSAKTVANNVSNILAKLQLAERGQAIVAARDAGLAVAAPWGTGKIVTPRPVHEGSTVPRIIPASSATAPSRARPRSACCAGQRQR